MILTNLNEPQQVAVTYGDGPLLVLAGAGSGKTRVLTHRVAHLISSGRANSENILLLTFTNKAAEEMGKKVKVLLGNDFLGQSGTFHSFSARVLRKYGTEIGVDQNFVIFDTDDQIDVVKQAMIAMSIDPKAVKPNGILGAISSAKNELIGPPE